MLVILWCSTQLCKLLDFIEKSLTVHVIIWYSVENPIAWYPINHINYNCLNLVLKNKWKVSLSICPCEYQQGVPKRISFSCLKLSNIWSVSPFLCAEYTQPLTIWWLVPYDTVHKGNRVLSWNKGQTLYSEENINSWFGPRLKFHFRTGWESLRKGGIHYVCIRLTPCSAMTSRIFYFYATG